jgi:hypothetical protein
VQKAARAAGGAFSFELLERAASNSAEVPGHSASSTQAGMWQLTHRRDMFWLGSRYSRYSRYGVPPYETAVTSNSLRQRRDIQLDTRSCRAGGPGRNNQTTGKPPIARSWHRQLYPRYWGDCFVSSWIAKCQWLPVASESDCHHGPAWITVASTVGIKLSYRAGGLNHPW